MIQDLTTLHILLVDDQKDTRIVLRHMLQEIGITQVVEAVDAHQAEAILGNALQKIDLIFCDWNMPSMTGIDFLEHIRGMGNTIPFCMISGRGDHASIQLAKNSGVACYLRKPFSSTQMEAKIRTVLQRQHSLCAPG